jgi:micrococcal nuclease
MTKLDRAGVIAGFVLVFIAGWVAGQSKPQPAVQEVSAKTLDLRPKEGTYLILPVRAIDGDTIEFYWLATDRGRLLGINAPELHGDSRIAGEAAKLFLSSKLPTRPIPARVGVEKYGRTLLDVILDDGSTLGQVMIKGGHAKPWDGTGARP